MKWFFSQPKSFSDYLRLIIKLGLALILFLPLVTSASFYFPFIVPRNILFRLILNIILVLYLYLIVRNRQWLPKFNKGVVIFFLFIVSLTISSLLGGNFSFSFWSNFERMDGLLNWYYLLIYVFVLLGTLRQPEEWKNFFRISLVAAWLISLYGLAQKFGLSEKFSFIMPSSGESRIASTFGNAAYVGSYMFLHFTVALYLLLINFLKPKFFSVGNIFYALSLILFAYLLITTQTRGAFLGLLVFLFLLLAFYLVFKRKQRTSFYYLFLSLLVLSLLSLGLLFTQKNNSWVRSNPLLGKLTNISLTDTTVESRLAIWQNSLQGVKDKPILGWGEENFQYVFNKYFPVKIYHDVGSEVWFDRPHNILVQHLVQGGILGLGLYLGVFVYLIIALLKKYKKDNQWFFGFFWIAFIGGFLFQDLFIFDSLNTNVILYLLLAFLFRVGIKSETPPKIKTNFGNYKEYLSWLFIILLAGYSSWIFFYRPMKSSQLLIKSFQGAIALNNSSSLNTQTKTAFIEKVSQQVINDWEKSKDLSFLGDKEKGEILLRIFETLVRHPAVTPADKNKVFSLTQDYLEKLSRQYPHDIRINMFLSYLYGLMSEMDVSFALKNIDLLESLKAWAPQRPDIYTQLSRAYLLNNNLALSKAAAQQAVVLLPQVKFVYWNLAALNLIEGDAVSLKNNLGIIKNLNQQKLAVDFTTEDYQQLQVFREQAINNKQIEIEELLKSYLPE
jgi:O-antigen ligase